MLQCCFIACRAVCQHRVWLYKVWVRHIKCSVNGVFSVAAYSVAQHSVVQYKVCVQHMDGAQAGKQQTDCHPPTIHCKTLSCCKTIMQDNYVHKSTQDNARHCQPLTIHWRKKSFVRLGLKRQHKRRWKRECWLASLAWLLLLLLIDWGHVFVPDTHCGHKSETFHRFW